MSEASRPVVRALVLAVALLGLGFVVGYGFHTATTPKPQPPKPQPPTPDTQSGPGPQPPQVKGLRASRDGRSLAFTAVYDDPPRATRFLLDVGTKRYQAIDSPGGWQDFTMQWSDDGRSILFDRERIPRMVASTAAGLYREPVTPGPAIKAGAPTSLTPTEGLPGSEKSVAGFWDGDGRLIVKSQNQAKALYRAAPGGAPGVLAAQLADRASGTYLQDRAITQNGKSVLFVVRNIAGPDSPYALFRIGGDGVARRISDALPGNIEWSYLSDDAKWLIVCCKSPSGSGLWSLYTLGTGSAALLKTGAIPADVISVFWSPSDNRILGAGGKSLWTIDIPSLKAHPVGPRQDWNVQDAAWIDANSNVVVASAGSLWRVNVDSAQAQTLWKFPGEYWQ